MNEYKKKLYTKEKRLINYQKEAMKKDLLELLIKEYQTGSFFDPFNIKRKNFLIKTVIKNYMEKYRVSLEYDFYYYYLYDNYEFLVNKAKKYNTFNLSYTNDQMLSFFNNENVKIDYTGKNKKENKNKNSLLYFIIGYLFK